MSRAARVLFDLDHTLMLNPFWPYVFPAIGAEIAARAAAPTTGDAVVATLVAESLELYRCGRLESQDWDALSVRVAEQHGVVWTRPVAELVEQGVETARVVDGAADLLRELRGDGHELVAVSQGFRRYQLPPLRHLGLLDLFDRHVFSDDLKSLKANFDFWRPLAAGDRATVVVGDAYVEDCLYPRHFGLSAIWFTGVRTVGELDCGTPPAYRTDLLAEVPELVRALALTGPLPPPAASSLRCARCGGPSRDSYCTLCACVMARLGWA